MFVVFLIFSTVQGIVGNAEEFGSMWHYECKGGFCEKELIRPWNNSPRSLEVCQLFCGTGGPLWPKPTGTTQLQGSPVHLDPTKIELRNVSTSWSFRRLLQKNVDLLKRNIAKMANGQSQNGGLSMEIYPRLDTEDDGRNILNVSEAYVLLVEPVNDNMLHAFIWAESYFGLRHGLVTLSQLIVYNDLTKKIETPRKVFVADRPVYPYRGILLDTSRNFIDKASILRTIEAMGMSKMNMFHWHITDSQSFPYVSRTFPKLSQYGAYTPRKVYTGADVKEIIDFGLLHGVRVLPEYDAPAHVGEGWQWVGENATVCFGAEPWRSYCGEPPCGQLNPGSDRVYEILEGIYKDMVEDFKPEIFHMGGDEVNIECWRSSPAVTEWMTKRGWNLSEASFYEVWNVFQERAYEKLRIANGGKDLPVVLWTSGLTSAENIHHLDPQKHIIQIWTTANDPTIGRLVRNKFRMIFSNYDALYLDCGFGAWLGTGNNWCSPYKDWQTIYENSPLNIIKQQGFTEADKHLILGGEAALWSEQAGSSSVDSRLWPRAAALAERLWAEPPSSWVEAQPRMLMHRERLVQRGILADSLEPEWCLRNAGRCT